MFAKNVAERSYRDVGLIAIGGAGLRSDLRSDFPLIFEHIHSGGETLYKCSNSIIDDIR
jgi:hypothetical protein